jgi:hypothetical protein
MRAARLLSFTLALSTVALASNETLPRSTSTDVRSAIEKADAALADGDRQFALALYEGSLYPDGLKLAIDEDTLDHSDQLKGVYGAIGVWESELDGDLPVKVVDRPEEADVVVRFVDAIPERGSDTLGLIKLEKSYRWSRRARSVTTKGTISIVRSAGGDRLDIHEIRDVAMHELGHLLGLADASEVGVLMGPLERGKPLSRPTTVEVDDVKSLRRTLRLRIRAAEAAAN